jgi:hypothetical protein
MARFYFHLRAGDEFIPDMTGVDLEDSGASARHIMRILEKVGVWDYRGWSFEITDEGGEFVDRVKVEEIVGAVH